MNTSTISVDMHNTLPEDYQNMLFPYAYNILGSVEDAKDIAQEAIIKFMQNGKPDLENPKSYLIKIVVNLSINHKKLVRHQREFYPGPWLPEPMAIDRSINSFDKEKILTYSLLVMLEKMTSKERAVYILKEVFSYSHSDIAEVLDIAIENSRQLLKRGKQKIEKRQPMAPMTLEENEYVEAFLRAFDQSDFSALERLLIDDIALSSDSGGKAQAARNVIRGKVNVMKMLRGLAQKFYKGTSLELRELNHEPAFIVRSNGNTITTILFDISEDKIDNVYLIRNPDKMNNL